MSIFTPTSNWSEIQERTIDPQSKYDSDIVNQITAVGGGERYKVTGLLADLVYDTDDDIPFLHVTSGIAVKDYVVIQFTDESYVSFGEPWPVTQGNYYLVIYYKYEKQVPPPEAELRFITEANYDPEYHFPLYKIVVNGETFPDDIYMEQLEFGKNEEREYVFVERMSSEYQYTSESGGETSIDITQYYNEYTKEYAVYINGIYQREGSDYTVDHVQRRIILSVPLETNDYLVFMSRQWGRPNSDLSSFYSQEELNNGVLDIRYYTETEIDDFFEGEDTGKKQVDWNRILNTPTSMAGYGIDDGVTNVDLTTHADTTINVHGIVDSSDLAYKSGSVNQFSDITSPGSEIEDAVDKKHEQNTDTGTGSDTFQIGIDGPIIKNNIGNFQLRNNLDDDYVNLEVANLTVHGTTTTLYTEEVTIDDNILLLNSNVTGTPTEDAGLEIERGDLNNVSIIWDEDTLLWRAGFTGTEKALIREDDMVVLYGQVNGSGNFNSDGVASIATIIDMSSLDETVDGGGAIFAAFNGGFADTPEEEFILKYKVDGGNAAGDA
ncbi:MAG: hypothetical protein ACP5D2_04410 [Candidatus Nanoarchaeia archaeon]